MVRNYSRVGRIQRHVVAGLWAEMVQAHLRSGSRDPTTLLLLELLPLKGECFDAANVGGSALAGLWERTGSRQCLGSVECSAAAYLSGESAVQRQRSKHLCHCHMRSLLHWSASLVLQDGFYRRSSSALVVVVLLGIWARAWVVMLMPRVPRVMSADRLKLGRLMKAMVGRSCRYMRRMHTSSPSMCFGCAYGHKGLAWTCQRCRYEPGRREACLRCWYAIKL